jgi:hypothetical protein
MASYGVSAPAGIILRVPTRREIRTMLTRTGIAITAIIAVTVVLLGFVGAIVFLVWHDKSTEALTFAVVTPLIGMLVSVMGRVRSIESKVDAAAVSSNGDGVK